MRYLPFIILGIVLLWVVQTCNNESRLTQNSTASPLSSPAGPQTPLAPASPQKVVVYFFTSPNCVWCQKFKATTLKDSQVQAALGEQGLYKLVVVGPHDVELMRQFNVRAYPTFVRNDTKAKHEGYMTVSEFVAFLQ